MLPKNQLISVSNHGKQGPKMERKFYPKCDCNLLQYLDMINEIYADYTNKGKIKRERFSFHSKTRKDFIGEFIL